MKAILQKTELWVTPGTRFEGGKVKGKGECFMLHLFIHKPAAKFFSRPLLFCIFA